jgi:hypothetical protein
LRALFSSKKRAICAILCFFASAALLVYSYPYKDIAVTSGIYYFAEIGYTMAKGLTVVVYLTEATAYAATIALLINLLAEAWRIAKGKKVGGFTVFRYTILLIVSVAAWILPAFATQPFALPVSPALWIAVASIVMFAFNIIAASHNSKKKKAAEAAAAAKKAQEKKQTTDNASAAKEGKK